MKVSIIEMYCFISLLLLLLLLLFLPLLLVSIFSTHLSWGRSSLLTYSLYQKILNEKLISDAIVNSLMLFFLSVWYYERASKKIYCALSLACILSRTHARSFGQVTQRFVLFCFVLFCFVFFSWRLLPFDTLRRQQRKSGHVLVCEKKIKTSLTVSRSIPVKSDSYYWLQHSTTLISSGL